MSETMQERRRAGRVREMAADVSGEFTDVLIVSELRGGYPDVPFFADVDLAELTKGDTDPLYLTIPIGKANVISGNRRFYDEKWLQELERQVIATRPIGIMGHLSDKELATQFPDEAIFWLGVRRIGEMLWAKGYIPAASAARDRIRRYKASNKAIGTSIFATAEGIWNEARGAYDMVADTLKLQQIDIGPADRIGIPDLASVPILTAEMHEQPAAEPESEQADNNQEAVEMDRDEVIKGLTPQDIAAMPAAVREAIAAGAVQEMRQALSLDAKTDVVAHVRELQAAEETRRQETVSARIRELVADAEKGVKLESARGLVVELVQARQPATVAEAETAYQAVVGSDGVKALLATQVQEIMGPGQTTGLRGQGKGGKYFDIPQEESEKE